MSCHARDIGRSLVTLLAAVLLALTALPSSAAEKAPAFKALLFTKAVGYVHGSIPAGIQMVKEEAEENGFEVDQTDDSTVFNDAALAEYDVIIMLQNSGMVWDTDEQRAAMQKYVQSGGGVAAIHNTLDMGIENEFPWWDELINGGAHMPSHSPGVLQGTAKVADKVHPSTKGLPERWERPEEWYNFDVNPRGDVHVLVTADETTYNPGGDAMGADHPISWCRNAEGGKVWATAMGHDTPAYSEEEFRDHVIGGVKWAMRRRARRLRRHGLERLREGHPRRRHRRPDGAGRGQGRPRLLRPARGRGPGLRPGHPPDHHRGQARRLHRRRGRPGRHGAGSGLRQERLDLPLLRPEQAAPRT